ncbi:EAL domain-containing protein [Lederbergia citri]|uniref:EAL domain-containing protein n=1 Tax=Lederbergia citri TaxID=2833580 RepID=A0A942YHG4_9BACI|nr:EAL domain-containing protein [Lederbergia citri]MBS4195754.1 EAL domain-containing protein [Lederbergia citri]
MNIRRFIQQARFYHFFQPIYELHNRNKIGYEALLRSEEYPNPEIAFQLAKKEHQLFDLDVGSMRKALSTYLSTSENGLIFLNIYPSTLLDPRFISLLKRVLTSREHNSRIVLEVSESELIEDIKIFKERISTLKQDGFLIAIDDMGRGYSRIESIIELEPDYIKLDRLFAKDLHLSPKKKEFISIFQTFCDHYGSQLILEGVETSEELEMAKSLGVVFAQGYFLGKPAMLTEAVLI